MRDQILSRFALPAIALACGWPFSAAAQDNRPRLAKPEQVFFFYQVNFSAGYDTREPESGWGAADRGAANQVAFELFGKMEKNLQRGYIPWVAPIAWNAKIGLEYNPAEETGGDPTLDVRLLDTFVRFETKWDRTSLTLGHRGIPYGQNPRLDTELTFAPNQANADLGFGRDTGAFLQAPVASQLDLNVALTAGGTLAGPIGVVKNGNGGSSLDFDDRLDYRDSFLVTARVGRPRFYPQDGGVFVAAGKLHRATGELTEIRRLGADWVIKSREDWVLVNQISIGENLVRGQGDRRVANLLNGFELFLGPSWRLGLTHTFRYEDPDASGAANRENGTVFGSISWALTRDARLRLNPFFEWRDTAGSRESGLLVQMCVGCGLQK